MKVDMQSFVFPLSMLFWEAVSSQENALCVMDVLTPYSV